MSKFEVVFEFRGYKAWSYVQEIVEALNREEARALADRRMLEIANTKGFIESTTGVVNPSRFQTCEVHSITIVEEQR